MALRIGSRKLVSAAAASTRFMSHSRQAARNGGALFRSFSHSAKSASPDRQGKLIGALGAGLALGAAAFIGSSTAATADSPAVEKSRPEASIRYEMSLSEPSGAPVVTRSGRVLPKLHIFIGYDPREHEAYEVCRHSILKHATVPVEITPIKQSHLRSLGLYTRTKDPTESTEFSFTRFLTPFLAGFEGWAMFVDCDFLYTADVRELAELIDDKYAIMCVQHDYTPKSATKMDGVVQTTYPRKNWSSMVLYNCSHPKNRVLTPMVVNSQSGAFLHRFLWLDEADIGAIPFTWNFLVGHNKVAAAAELPKAIHYTQGGPWFEAWKNCEFAELWIKEREDFQRTQMIQKVIQDDLLKYVSTRMEGRGKEIDAKLAELENRLSEVSGMQRLLLHYFQQQENRVNTSSNSNNGSTNGLLNASSAAGSRDFNLE